MNENEDEANYKNHFTCNYEISNDISSVRIE